MKKSCRAFNFNVGLLYPAVLGSIIYTVLDTFSFENIIAEPVKHITVLLILLQYVFDYLYTNTDEIKTDYSALQGICDFAIVVILFISINAISENPRFVGYSSFVPLLLAVSKFSALSWELFRGKKNSLAIALFGTFTFLYAVTQLLIGRCPYLLLIVLFLDCLAFVAFEFLRGKVKVPANCAVHDMSRD